MDRIAIEAFLYSADCGEDYYLLASSSSSSDYESDCNCSCSGEAELDDSDGNQAKRSKVEGFAELTAPLFDDTDFKNTFRVSKATCEQVTELISGDFSSDHKGGWERITPTKAAYVLLWYLGSQETYKQISDRFKITQSCVHNIVNVGCRSLSSRVSEFIKWPGKEEYEEESKAFFDMSKVYGIIGAICVSHIKILKPKDDHEKYKNKRNYHSIAIQGVVGSKGNFIDLSVSDGSIESYEILNKSVLSTKGYEGELGDYFIVGTNSYPTFHWLVTPFPNLGNLTDTEEEFNRCLGKACRFVRDAFGKLKERFQRLDHCENKDMLSTVQTIKTACVVHNICLTNNDDCELFSRDDGIFDTEYEFDGEVTEKRLEVFNAFLEERDKTDRRWLV